MKTPTANPTLADALDRRTVVGTLAYREDERIRCVACGHRCLIGEGKRGICKVRFVEDGELRVPFGYVAGLQCDPVEKKPFFHVYPGSDALTFGMMGCDLHCSYCQNWVTSQALRDSAAVAPVRPVTPEGLVELALREGARLVVSSYNEPLITAEWGVAVFEKARAAGLACAFVSNGNATPEVLDYLAPWIVAYKVDLKSFDDQHYRSLGGMLGNITDTIRMIHERGIWLEVVTLVIPGFNDGEVELRSMARFLASVSRDIPWHVTAFHKDYRMTDPDATSPAKLMRACEIGVEEGLRHVYAGNLPGRVGSWENTRCPSCGETLIERTGYLIRSYRLTSEGCCPKCQTRLPGLWPSDRAAVRTGNDMAAFRQRLPRPLATIPSSPENRGPNIMTPTQHAELSDEEKQRLVTVAGQLVRALISGQTPTAADLPLEGLGERTIAGAFVSLKRGKHLRACCGMFGQPIPLGRALIDAATRSVWEDMRFPPISPAEIDHLDMEVWLLHEPQRVSAVGEERAASITVGKHGVKVVRGGNQGLFLPSVALENQWDVRRTLNQVCIKAGLPPTAWLDEATALFRFEGEVVRGRPAGPTPEPRAGVGEAKDLRALNAFCCQNIGALLNGATPTSYLAGTPDGNVAGAIVTLQRSVAGHVETMSFCQLSLRPGVPLQSTLLTLCQSAAPALSANWLGADPQTAVEVAVTILHDPVLHGAVADADWAGFESNQRAVVVFERNKSGVVFDPARSAAELLAEAARQCKVTQPKTAAVYSLAALSQGPVSLSTAPRPMRGPAVRQPGVAGRFYPADPVQLAKLLDTLLEGEAIPETCPAAMLPHAGLVYSGRIAAGVLKRLHIPRTVIILGPKHTAFGVDWAVAPHQTWAFPGGRLESDVALAEKLAGAIDGLELDAVAHQREHAIEVELPLLARLAPETRVVGIVIGAGDLTSCLQFAEGLARVIRECDEPPLLLISSDMNHFAADAENRRLDAIALDALERLDPAGLYETVTEQNISMCGILPAVIVLQTLRLLGQLHRAERIGYATSADVSGDTSRVVGYAGMVLK